jgi:hypothetical protein
MLQQILSASRQRAAAPKTYKRPTVSKRRENVEPGEVRQRLEPGELPASSVMSVRPQIPQWLQNKKVKYNRTLNGGNKLFYHNNRSRGARYYVRVGLGENITNGQILPPVPIPRNIRLPTPAPRPFVPTPVSRKNNKNNAKYVKSMITNIIHKLTEPNRRNKANREYITRLVGGIVSKIKRQNVKENKKNKQINSENVFTRKPTRGGVLLPAPLNKKTQVIRALMAKGMSEKEAIVKELFMNNNNVNNLLRRKTPNTRSPRQYNTGGKRYRSPPKLPQITAAETEAAIKALPFTQRQVNQIT